MTKEEAYEFINKFPRCRGCDDDSYPLGCDECDDAFYTALNALKEKEQEKKQITLQKKHVITWSRNDEFSMKKLYEAICETLLDEGELFIERTDDHEQVEFVFYVAAGRCSE